jgi:hypothetical protein
MRILDSPEKDKENVLTPFLGGGYITSMIKTTPTVVTLIVITFISLSASVLGEVLCTTTRYPCDMGNVPCTPQADPRFYPECGGPQALNLAGFSEMVIAPYEKGVQLFVASNGIPAKTLWCSYQQYRPRAIVEVYNDDCAEFYIATVPNGPCNKFMGGYPGGKRAVGNCTLN